MATVCDEGERTCPLCTEEMDLTDQQLKPCKCGYEICVWCWHQIMNMAEKDEMEGRCPACRTPYDKEKIVGMAANCERMVCEINNERRLKSQKPKLKASEGRKHLSSVRVIQRNLVYIIGLSANLADESTLERKEFFGQYGKILKVSISKPASGSQHPSNTNSCCVYITYAKEEEAVRCIQSVHGYVLDGRSLRACFGTTKYCHTWLRNMPCNNPDCLYLHDMGTPEDSFSKDELISAYTRSRAQHIMSTMSDSQRRPGNVLPAPVDDFSNKSSVSSGNLAVKNPSNITSNHAKASSSMNHSSRRSSVLPAAASWGMRASGCQQAVANTECLQAAEKPKADMANGSSTFSNMGDNGVKAPKTVEVSDIVHLTNQSGLDATNYMGHQATTSASSMVFIDSCTGADPDRSSKQYESLKKSSASEDGDRHQSCGSNPCEIANKCALIDVNLERESIRLSSLDISNDLAVEDPIIDGHLIPKSKYFLTGLDGCPAIVTKNHSEEGNDSMKMFTSLPPSTNEMVRESSCASNEVPVWSSWLETSSGTVTGGSPLPAGNAQLKYSEAAARPLNFSSSYSPLKGPSCSKVQSLEHVESATPSILGSADSRTVDVPLPSGNSFLLNGHDKKFCNFNQRIHDDCGEAVACSESVDTTDAFDFDKSPEVGLGENSIISDILSLDLDAWDASLSSPPSLAKLFGKTDNQNCSLKPLNSWKRQNQSQSRFSFARQEDLSNNAYTHSESYPTINVHLLNPKSNLQGFVNQDVFWNSLNVSEGLANSFVSCSEAAVSRAPFSAPPGFSASIRSPPGFSSHERIDQALVSPSSGNQMLQNQLRMEPSHPPTSRTIVDRFDDVEFIDPAILAVGRGTLQFPLSGNADFDVASTFSAHLNAPEQISRHHFSMEQSFNHQNFRFPGHLSNRFSPSNELYAPSWPLDQSQHITLSDRAHMSLMPSKDSQLPYDQWRGWNEFQTESDPFLSELLRNERLGLNQYFPSYEDIKIHLPSSDLYNRAFGM